MDLKDFVSQTLKQINDGLQEGHQHVKTSGGEGVHNGYFNVAFDVALTTNNEESSDVGGKITVASIFQAGGKKEKTTESTNYSRIQFSVSVHVKTGK
ncbi:MAG TPA: hypothetical protein VGF30_09830 [Bacteroidia bacterium]